MKVIIRDKNNMLSRLKPEVRVSEDDTEIELSIPAFGLHNVYNPGDKIFQWC